FSFAIWDVEKRRLFAARDRAGEKPFFYSSQPRFFAFSSELKALMALPFVERKINPSAYQQFLAYGYVPGDICILQGVQKLRPAHALIVEDGGRCRTWAYWQVPAGTVSNTRSVDELADELDELLGRAVKRQLVSDVPLGICLSGGIDSSLVTAMAARASQKPVRTFTVVFPGSLEYDEGPYAKIVAEHFGTRHTELQTAPASVELLPVLARQFDEPCADSSMVPTYLLSRLIRQECTVALGGDGGDELFGGYRHYTSLMLQSRLRRILPEPFRSLIQTLCRGFLPSGVRGYNSALGLGGTINRAVAHTNILFTEPFRRKLTPRQVYRVHTEESEEPTEWKASLFDSARGMPGGAMNVDFLTYLPDDILVKVDRASMLNSLEVRCPWLDFNLIEFAFRNVPNSCRATLGQKKILPKVLGKRLLPKALNLDRKQGFSLPLRKWMKGAWGQFFTEILSSVDHAIFDQQVVRRLIETQNRGLVNHTERLFCLTMFELWRREYRASF
ncbi:MAG: asparagine synthase (glutamine-hydrolyzing), partial [Verrucomicrobia bacterium]